MSATSKLTSLGKPRDKTPIRYMNKTHRVLTVPYKAYSRGKKENFKKKKDTIFKKANIVADESGAGVLVLMYQSHIQKWHMCHRDPDTGKADWPFDVQQFVSLLNIRS